MAFKRSSNSAGGLLAAFDSGTAGQKAAFQSSVSGGFKYARRSFSAAPSAPGSGAPAVTVGGTSSSISGGKVFGCEDPGITYRGPSTLQFWNFSYVFATSGRFTVVEFWTDAQNFDLAMLKYNTQCAIYADGVLASNKIQFDASGSPVYVNVSFSSAGIRRIQVKGVNMPFGGVVVPAGYSIWSDDGAARPIIGVFGDSYSFGNGATLPASSWAHQMGAALGYDVLVDAIGGTGWTSTGANLPVTRLTSTVGINNLAKRRSGVNAPITPVLHLCAFGYNDAGGNMTTLSAAATAYFNAATVKPHFVGPWTPLGSTGNLTLVKNALIGVATAVGAKFIDIDGWVNANNKSSLTGADNVHPVQAGHDFLGVRIAGEVSTLGLA